MKKNWNLEPWFPPGIQGKDRLDNVFAGYVLGALYSIICYGTRLGYFYWHLFADPSEKTPIEDAVMEDFKTVTNFCSLGFALLIALMIYQIIANYRYHYQGSKSIYLMKRLPKKTELHRRCLAFPVAVILLILATICLLNVIYHQVYLFVTPPQCLHQ